MYKFSDCLWHTPFSPAALRGRSLLRSALIPSTVRVSGDLAAAATGGGAAVAAVVDGAVGTAAEEGAAATSGGGAASTSGGAAAARVVAGVGPVASASSCSGAP